MSYYSFLSTSGHFLSALNEKELAEAFENYKKKLLEDDDLWKGLEAAHLVKYGFRLEGTEDNLYRYELTCECDEFFNTHYADERLAEFISKVIAKGYFCLYFDGQDDTDWGWFITPGSVRSIKYFPKVFDRDKGEYIDLDEACKAASMEEEK